MIGSRAKRAQLARRLAERGLPPGAIERVTCPIGAAPGLPRGKHPGTIAVAVAAEILARRERAAPAAAAPVRSAGA
jgi:xanthine/CO dehydrogenase XdhC/CoxF family maturation factor